MKWIAVILAMAAGGYAVPSLANDASSMRQMYQAQRMMQSQQRMEMRRQGRYEQDEIAYGRKSVTADRAWEDDADDEDEEKEEQPEKPYFHYVY